MHFTGPIVDVHHSQSLDMVMLSHQKINNGDMNLCIPTLHLANVPVDANVHVCMLFITECGSNSV